MATSNIGFQSFYQSQLTSAISNTDLTIPLDVLPTPSEGYLVIESTVSAAREIIYYTSKTATAVVVPSGAGNGRGFDGTTAVSHTQSATVIMAPIGAMFGNQAIKDMLGVTTDVTGGWNLLASGTPSTITALGNRSYTVLIPSADTTSATSVGMRLKLPRTVTAPTGSITLNGTTQYANDTSVSGMTFTDDFVVSAWVKLSSYPSGNGAIASRFNGTNGWIFIVTSTGQIEIFGQNGGGNTSYAISYQSIPLNKWVHVSALLDMSAFTAAAATAETAKSWIMIDGVEVPASVTRTGTNPTTLVQAGNLEIGSYNGGTNLFTGQIAQVAIYSTRVLQATVRASMNQTLTGSETSLISAYKLDQASGLNDLAATVNNLTAQGSPSYSTTQTPFTNPVTGTSVTAGTTNYGIITAQTFSTNTTYTVQIPEGETLPTTGGIGTISYSTQKTPYGFPGDKYKWSVIQLHKTSSQASAPTDGLYYWATVGSQKLTVPIGSWIIRTQQVPVVGRNVSGAGGMFHGLSTSNTAWARTAFGYGHDTAAYEYFDSNAVITSHITSHAFSTDMNNSSATDIYQLVQAVGASMNIVGYRNDLGGAYISAELAYL